MFLKSFACFSSTIFYYFAKHKPKLRLLQPWPNDCICLIGTKCCIEKFFFYFKYLCKTGKMDHYVKMLDAETDNLSFLPEIHMSARYFLNSSYILWYSHIHNLFSLSLSLNK